MKYFYGMVNNQLFPNAKSTKLIKVVPKTINTNGISIQCYNVNLTWTADHNARLASASVYLYVLSLVVHNV